MAEHQMENIDDLNLKDGEINISVSDDAQTFYFKMLTYDVGGLSYTTIAETRSEVRVMVAKLRYILEHPDWRPGDDPQDPVLIPKK